jgi:hypothetical protein
MATIPEVRITLGEIADKMRNSSDIQMVFLASEVDLAIKDLVRRHAPRIAPRTAGPLTEAQKAQIWALARRYPNMSQLAIANTVKVNPGRVSETLRGKRR